MRPRHTPRSPWLPLGVALLASLVTACAGPGAQVSTETAAEPAATVAMGTAEAKLLMDESGDRSIEAMSLPVDASLVTQEVERRLGALQACQEERLAIKPDLTGEILIHYGINETGVVNEACITSDTTEDKGLIACVNHLVASGPYPASSLYPLDISVPLVFTSG